MNGSTYTIGPAASLGIADLSEANLGGANISE